MTEMSMRERVAQALCEEANGRFASHNLWRGWQHYADAAIAAMREPTKAMVTAADETFQPYWPDAAPFDVEWRAAIDAALSDKPAV